LTGFQEFFLKAAARICKGQNLALTVSYVPSLLDRKGIHSIHDRNKPNLHRTFLVNLSVRSLFRDRNFKSDPQRERGAFHYRGTSLTRKRTPLGPSRRPMPRVLGGS